MRCVSAVPIVEAAMAAIVLADFYLINKIYKKYFQNIPK
jgi:hypothetical protein